MPDKGCVKCVIWEKNYNALRACLQGLVTELKKMHIVLRHTQHDKAVQRMLSEAEVAMTQTGEMAR
jgi:hypothetical protein